MLNMNCAYTGEKGKYHNTRSFIKKNCETDQHRVLVKSQLVSFLVQRPNAADKIRNQTSLHRLEKNHGHFN